MLAKLTRLVIMGGVLSLGVTSLSGCGSTTASSKTSAAASATGIAATTTLPAARGAFPLAMLHRHSV